MRFAIVLLAACGSTSSPKREPPPAGSASGSELTIVELPPMHDLIVENAQRARCLPVVAKNCNCTYDCMLGQSWDKEKTFLIDWHGKEIVGVVENYCVDGKCTDVFAVELTCDGICPRKAANPNCRIETPVIQCKSS